jgi:hypothetical protein
MGQSNIRTTRVSVSSEGQQGNYDSIWPSISADGRFVAFESHASNLIPGDTNDTKDVFVHDQMGGVTVLVSVSSEGEQGNNSSWMPFISADGRFVAYASHASNLVLEDTNGLSDIFVYDLKSGITERVSVSAQGQQGDGPSYHPSISADGRFVVYQSTAANLVTGDTNEVEDIFIYDRVSHVTEIVSVSSEGERGNGSSKYPFISADAKFVAFSSLASNLVTGDTNGTGDVFIRDLENSITERVSVSSDDQQGNGLSEWPAISADGHIVAFHSDASNLVPEDTNGATDTFVHDRESRVTERVSVSSEGLQGKGMSWFPSITADGRFVGFISNVSTLVPGDTDGRFDIFVHDRLSGLIEIVSISSEGQHGEGNSEYLSISADGRFVAIHSLSSKLVTGDTNGSGDIFVHDRCVDGSCGYDPDWVNYLPSISTLNPPGAAPESEGMILLVRGTDFVDGALVFWNKEALSTSFISVQELEAMVPASQLVEPGTANITVFNPWPHPGPSAPASFYVSWIQPGDDSTALVRRPPFQWPEIPGAASYQVQIATASNFSTLLMSQTSSTPSLTPTKDLPLNKTIYWRVRAKVNGSYQSWSTRYSFRSANPPSNPTLRSPANNALTTDYVPKLTWSQSSLPSGTTFEEYQLQVARDKGVTDLAFERLLADRTTPSYTVVAGELLPNTTYYWRVRASNTLGHTSNWSKPFTLRAAMLPTTLTSPAEASTAVTPRPKFEWSTIEGANNYSIQISLYSNFSELLISAKPTGTTYIPTKNLPQNRTIYWRVRGNGVHGPSLWTKGSFKSANPPSTPALVSPANKALNTDYLPRFSWRASALPSGTTFLHYRLQVAKDSAFTQELQEKLIDSRTMPFYQYLEEEMLDPDTRYYWRVQARNNAEHYSTWSAVRYFRTAMVKPTLLTPAEGITVTTRRPSFEWMPDAGATSYTIQLSAYSNFSTLIRSAIPAGPTWTSTVSLPQNKTIYWRVRANGDNGPSLWAVRTFKSANPPSTPALVSPSNGVVLNTLTPKLDWSNSTLPAGTNFKHYELHVATDTAFTDAKVYFVNDRMMSDYTMPVLTAKTRYYWRVQAVNMDDHQSNWSSRRSFTTP